MPTLHTRRVTEYVHKCAICEYCWTSKHRAPLACPNAACRSLKWEDGLSKHERRRRDAGKGAG